MKRIKENKLYSVGAMVLCIVAISLVMLAVVLNLEAVGRILKTVGDVFSPLVIGAVLAYLMNPLMNFLDRRLKPFLIKRKMKPEKARKLSRVISLLFALLVSAILVYEFCALLLPQLYESIRKFIHRHFKLYFNTTVYLHFFAHIHPPRLLLFFTHSNIGFHN